MRLARRRRPKVPPAGLARARRRRDLMHGMLLVLIALYSLFPIYMMGILSLKSPQEDVYGNPFFVRHPSLEWYYDLFEATDWIRGGTPVKTVPYLIWLQNTFGVFVANLLVILPASLMAAYALSRLRPPGWRWWRRAMFATYLFPQTLLFLPMYHLVIRLHLDDNLAALLLTYPMLAMPFCVWLLSAYFQRLPVEVEESAFIEGASRLTAFLRIVLPMSWPVVVTAGIFTLGVISSDMLFAMLFLTNPIHQTVAAGLSVMEIGMEDISVIAGVNLAALAVVPVCAVFAGAYVRGLTAAMIEGA